MTVQDFFIRNRLEKTLLMGYYGGGNYGDELLLEIMLNLLSHSGVKQADIAYMPYCKYATYHHDFGYQTFQANSPMQLLRTILRSRNVIIGGGGIWGLDAQFRSLLMSVALVISRLCGKRVYLIGVGYYNSTNLFGHIGAWLAAKASHAIIARDEESQRNFSRLNPNVSLDADIAWHMPEINLAPYQQDSLALQKRLNVTKKTLIITLRRFQEQYKNNYTETVEQCIAANPHVPIIVALMEPKSVDPDGYALIRSWQRKYPNVQVTDFCDNPITWFLFLRTHQQKLALIGPQFHALITAHMAGVPFFPLIYDNKSAELLRTLQVAHTTLIKDITPQHLQEFINQYAMANA